MVGFDANSVTVIVVGEQKRSHGATASKCYLSLSICGLFTMCILSSRVIFKSPDLNAVSISESAKASWSRRTVLNRMIFSVEWF